jgi:hypothetical protein
MPQAIAKATLQSPGTAERRPTETDRQLAAMTADFHRRETARKPTAAAPVSRSLNPLRAMGQRIRELTGSRR